MGRPFSALDEALACASTIACLLVSRGPLHDPRNTAPPCRSTPATALLLGKIKGQAACPLASPDQHSHPPGHATAGARIGHGRPSMGRHARWRCGRGMSAGPAVRCEGGRVRARSWQPRASRGAGLGNTGHGGAQGWGTRERGPGSHASLRAGDGGTRARAGIEAAAGQASKLRQAEEGQASGWGTRG